MNNFNVSNKNGVKVLLISSLIMGGTSLSGVITQVFAEEKQVVEPIEIETTTVQESETLEKSTEVLTNVETLNTEAKTLTAEASNLNKEIQLELERVREEKRLEEERKQQALETFVAQADNHNFYNYDITTKTNLTGEQLEVVLADTGLAGLGHAYAKAEQMFSVNAFALIGISALESSWGNSRFAQERNNLFGYQAYDSDTNKAKVFNSKDEAIMTVAEHLSKNYLDPSGPYYNGKTLADVNIRYASDREWSIKITGIMNRLKDKLNTQ